MDIAEEEVRKGIEAMPAYCHSRGYFAQEDKWRKVKFDIVSFEVPDPNAEEAEKETK